MTHSLNSKHTQSKTPVKNSAKELHYEFTNNSSYLKQYANLVVQYYKKDLNFDLNENNLAGLLTLCHENEYVFIVRKADKVLGGTKISFVKTESNQKLPLEDDVTIEKLVPNNYAADFYGEIGRLVIDPEYRGKEILLTMIDNLMSFSIMKNCHYLFVLAPKLNAVLYRRLCNQLKVPAVVHNDVSLPDKPLYKQMGIKLLSCDLTPKCTQLKKLRLAG